jgi:hypothetical protein
MNLRQWIVFQVSLLVGLLCIGVLGGCASQSEGWKMPYTDEDSQAAAEAFTSDMSVRKNMPHRTDAKPFEFYYKHCSVNGTETYYSKTSYDCSGPW